MAHSNTQKRTFSLETTAKYSDVFSLTHNSGALLIGSSGLLMPSILRVAANNVANSVKKNGNAAKTADDRMDLISNSDR